MLPKLADIRIAMREFMRSWEQGLKDIHQWEACCEVEHKLVDIEQSIIIHSEQEHG